MVNTANIIFADGSAFSNGKFRKYLGGFKKFKQLENGNWGYSALEWTFKHGYDLVKV